VLRSSDLNPDPKRPGKRPGRPRGRRRQAKPKRGTGGRPAAARERARAALKANPDASLNAVAKIGL